MLDQALASPVADRKRCRMVLIQTFREANYYSGHYVGVIAPAKSQHS
jgi:hypothetical protein